MQTRSASLAKPKVGRAKTFKCKYVKDKAGQELEQDNTADFTHVSVLRSLYCYKPIRFKESGE